MSQAEIDRKLARIKQAIKERQPDEARQLLIEVLKADPHNAEAWFVSSFLIKDPAAQLDAAQRALSINPNFEAARKRLAELQARQRGPTPLASVFDQEYEESASVPVAPVVPPAPAASVFADDATLIAPSPRLEESPFEPAVPEPVALDETRPAEATNLFTPEIVDAPLPVVSPFDDATLMDAFPPADDPAPIVDDAHASEKFPFDEPTAPPVAAPSDAFSFDEPVDAGGSVFVYDNPPMPSVESLATFNQPPPKVAATEGTFEDLIRANPDSERAIADADVLMMEDPLASPSKAKRPKASPKGSRVSLDQPYDPSVKQPRLTPTGKGSRKHQRAVKAAQKRSQNNQALLILLMGLMLIFVLVAGAFLLLRPQLNSLLGITPTDAGLPILVPTSPPTATLIPTTLPTEPPPTDAPATSVPVLAPTDIPTLTPTNAPAGETVLPPTQTLTPSPPPASASPPAGTPATSIASANTPSASSVQSAANADAPILTAFRDRLVQTKSLFRSTTFPRLETANAGQIVPLARVAIPGLFNVLFHDGQPTLIFQTAGFAARDSATFAIAGLLDDQPIMRLSIQAAAALDNIFLSRDQTEIVSVTASKLTVIDPASAKALRTIAASSSTSALSPDGHLAATAGSSAAEVMLWNVDTGELAHTITLDGLTADRGPNSLVFSDDSQVLAVGGCDGSIRVVDVASGKATTIQPGGEQFDCFDVLRFSPNGAYVLAADNSGFGRYRTVETSDFTNLSYAGLDANPRPRTALSADGTLVAAMNTHFLVLWNFADGQELARQPIGDATRVDGLTFSADGQFVIAATHGDFNGLSWYGIAGGSLAAQATATTQAQTARSTATADALAAMLQGSGRIVYARPTAGGQLGLFVDQPGTPDSAPLADTAPDAGALQPFSLTADGQQVAFVASTGLVVSAAGNTASPTVIDPNGQSPLLSPNGQYVFYRDGNGQCAVAQIDGKVLPFQGDKLDCNVTSAVWAPDSTALAVEQLYSSASETNSAAQATQILLMQVATFGVSAPVMVGPDSPRALDPAFRPDGQLTYLMFDVTAKDYAIFTSANGSSNATRLTTIPGNSTYHSHVWSPDGTRVALVEATAPEQVLVLSADGSLIAHVPGDAFYTQVDSLAWSPDGRFLAVSRSTADHAQARIFVVSADGTTSAPLTDGMDAVWVP